MLEFDGSASGIFTLSGLAVRNVGSAAVVSFLLAAFVATFTALTYCEFAAAYPETGEGYLYARRTFRSPVAYLVGWCLLLGYASSCAFYLASFSTYFQEFLWHSPWHTGSGVVALVLLTLLNIKGTKETGGFQVVVTAGKVVLLLWFVTGGLGSVDVPRLVDSFSTDVLSISSTGAMVFITFFGFSAIAASAGEVKDPVRNIPRAIFLSMIIVTVLYTLVVLVIVTAGLTEYNEAAMGEAARLFLGPIGGAVIVGGALFSMISASNASVMAGSRVALSMSRLGHLPGSVGAIDPRTRTPIVALGAVGAGILVFILVLPLEDLAHFADTVLLLALILVNAALIWNRRRYPDLVRPFRVPLVPVLPGLGILANIYLLTQIAQHPFPMVLAAGAIGVGFLGFLAWRGTEAEEVAEPVAHVVHEAPVPGRFKVLVPIAHPGHVPILIDIAAHIAADRGGELIFLRVVRVPAQAVPQVTEQDVSAERDLIERARERARLHGFDAVTSIVRAAHKVSSAILDTARERGCDLVVLGWVGSTSTPDRILGTTTEIVVNHSDCDVMLVKPMGDGALQRLLLPTAGGIHAQRAETYAASIARGQGGALLTLCRVVPRAPYFELVQRAGEGLDQAAERLRAHSVTHMRRKLIESDSITDGILEEASDYDAVVLGATLESLQQQILFGNIPERVAQQSDKTVIVVKHVPPPPSTELEPARRAAAGGA